MRLVIGGQGQGKLGYVLNVTKLNMESVTDGGYLNIAHVTPVVNHLHLFIRKLLKEKIEPLAVIESIIKNNEKIIFVCDEIGCGVVPTDPFEREWRETTGRILCVLAKQAKSVTRVFCGIGTTISGDGKWT
ncbi:MAG: bifunctional adenosylcobinamide kinase/adenosylcobinamide-phosphate guanylyltransferase [Clostridiales bacterium]|nr:bifunctional adenosylcobinamide kinase/adenosylcobinamide-phosphate guanylyltransferase [Clostridiales bacterium]